MTISGSVKGGPAHLPILVKTEAITTEGIMEALPVLLEGMSEFGFTSAIDMGAPFATEAIFDAYVALDEAGTLPYLLLVPIGEGLADGPLADRVKQVIDMQVNPAIASHGGSVTLVEVRDDVVYLEMMGGCQGCGMAAVTLAQGIRRIIMESVPEVRDIVDVTNHDAGDNPYY